MEGVEVGEAGVVGVGDVFSLRGGRFAFVEDGVSAHFVFYISTVEIEKRVFGSA